MTQCRSIIDDSNTRMKRSGINSNIDSNVDKISVIVLLG